MDIPKIKPIFLIPLLAIIVLYSSCGSDKNPATEKEIPFAAKVQDVTNLPKFPQPFEADFSLEIKEAEKLIESGIAFENKTSAHGTLTEKGFEFSSNEFESSDGVDITVQAKLYNSRDELNRAFEESLKEATKVFGQKTSKNGEKRFDGANDRNALVVYVSGSYLYTVFSPSMRHLIAFEIKEPAYFGGS